MVVESNFTFKLISDYGMSDSFEEFCWVRSILTDRIDNRKIK